MAIEEVSPIVALLVEEFKESKITLRELSERSGRPYATIQRFTKGHPVTTPTALSIADALGVAIHVELYPRNQRKYEADRRRWAKRREEFETMAHTRRRPRNKKRS